MTAIAAQDVIKAALGKLRVYGSTDTPSAEDMEYCFNALNDMLDSFSLEDLLIFGITEETLALTAGKYLYTVGPTGDLNTTLPSRVDDATFVRENATNIDTPMLPMTREEYNAITLKNTPNGIPEAYYYDSQYPLANLYIWPPPVAGYTLHLVSMKPFTSFADLVTTVNFAPGYKELMVFNLAVRIADDFKKEVSPQVLSLATNIKARVYARNARPIMATIDAPGAKVKRSGDNIYNRWGV